LPKIIKIDQYNSELYRFKIGAFLRHSVYSRPITSITVACANCSSKRIGLNIYYQRSPRDKIYQIYFSQPQARGGHDTFPE